MSRARDLADSADKDIVGTITVDGLTVAGNVSADGGTIKLDGNYPVGSANVALGDTALDSLTSGGNNTAVGGVSLTALTTGNNNHAFGHGALQSNVSGGENVAIGRLALQANTASANTAVGHNAGYNNTSGANNTAIGYASLVNNTTASNNTAVGYKAMYSNTTGGENVSVGREALANNTTGSQHAFFGYQAGQNNTTGNYNTFIGRRAGYSTTTGSDNTIVGNGAGSSHTTGSSNGFFGTGAGNAITSGSNNTILGRYNGNQGGLDIRTSSDNIVLSDGNGNPRASYTSASSGFWRIGHTAAGNLNDGSASGLSLGESGYLVVSHDGGSCVNINSMGNTPQFIAFRNGNSNIGSVSTNQSSVAYNTSSDYRLKENVNYTWDATTRLKELKPARFNFISDADTTVDGFLAHEAQAVVPECVTGTKDAVDDDGNAVMQGIDQSKLVPLLVKTIQELEARITALEGA